MTRHVIVKLPRLRYLVAAAALIGGCCALLVSTLAAPGASASAATARAWGVAQRIPNLDAIAATGNFDCPGDGDFCGSTVVNAVSCTASGDCTAGGEYTGQSGNDGTVGKGWVATESGGVWTAPKIVGLGATGNPSYTGVIAISCASPGNCAAVGYDSEETEATGFVDTYGAFYVNEVNGKWSAPRQIPGTDALNQGNYARADSVSCSAPGDCGVTGSVNGSSEFVDTETNGVWGIAELVPGFHYGPGSVEGEWPSLGPVISCPQPGDCTFASSDSLVANVDVTSVATETNGVWGDTAQLPGFAAAGGAVSSLSCSAVGDCSVGGWAYSGKQQAPFVASESGGTWTSSAVGGFAKLSPASVNTGSVTAISCASPGNCSAGGSYRPSAPEVNVFVVSEVNGVWQTARPVAGLAQTERGIGVAGISCPAAGDCGVVISRAGVGYVDLQNGGTWASPRVIAGTTNGGGASTVSCAAPGVCVAGGNDHGGTEVWVLSRSAQASTLTTESLSAAKLTYGTETAEKITAAVKATTPTPAGKVTVTANGKTLCTITLKNGTGTCQLTARQLKAGTYTLVAKYKGAAPYLASSSAAKTVKVAG